MLQLSQDSTVVRLGRAEMMIRIQPDLEVWSKHSPEAITLQQLDWSNLRVVAAVLGQSVALDYYARSAMLHQFQSGSWPPDTGAWRAWALIAHCFQQELLRQC